MKHFLDITRDIIKERNLDYSPELFKSILDEVKTTYETNRYLQDRLRNLVLRANWNKRIICRIKLTNNDLEIHRHRFDGFISQLENIDKQLKSVAMQYNEQRMKQLKTIFTIIRNYEN
jgi:hypothetical protein